MAVPLWLAKIHGLLLLLLYMHRWEYARGCGTSARMRLRNLDRRFGKWTSSWYLRIQHPRAFATTARMKGFVGGFTRRSPQAQKIRSCCGCSVVVAALGEEMTGAGRRGRSLGQGCKRWSGVSLSLGHRMKYAGVGVFFNFSGRLLLGSGLLWRQP